MTHQVPQPIHEGLYALPEIYEIAFSYRDIERECDFLTAVYRRVTGRDPSSVLELACGPGQHARAFAARGLRVAALDASPEMTAYVRSRLPDAVVLTADMADFRLPLRVDLAFTLLDSLPYLTTNERLVAHLRCVHRALRPGGVYVVELRHPAEVWFSRPREGGQTWTMERDGVRVTTHWGLEVQVDPIAQTERVLSRFVVERGHERRVVDAWGLLRPLLPQEFLALVELAGGWSFAGWWGDFDLDRPLTPDPPSWRFIIALRRA